MRKHLVIVVSIACIILNSCATKFSSSQRAALSSVKIEPTTFATDAYRDPSGAAPEAGTQTTLAAGGGLVGALIGETVLATQNKIFKKKEGAHFTKLKASTPKSVNDTLNQEITKSLKANLFFSNKVRSQSPNRVVSTINSYTLLRTGKKDKSLLMSPSITATIELIGSDGKSFGKSWRKITGVSSSQHHVSQYASDPSLLKKGYAEAARDLATKFNDQLNTRTAQ